MAVDLLSRENETLIFASFGLPRAALRFGDPVQWGGGFSARGDTFELCDIAELERHADPLSNVPAVNEAAS
ncbi:hypothetical protein BFN03_15715 [Rhodococcus sp. WMMA185]|nr:hypothetical protein BFN03_15715 [Rhodococcus sp. WMMA185]